MSERVENETSAVNNTVAVVMSTEDPISLNSPVRLDVPVSLCTPQSSDDLDTNWMNEDLSFQTTQLLIPPTPTAVSSPSNTLPNPPVSLATKHTNPATPTLVTPTSATPTSVSITRPESFVSTNPRQVEQSADKTKSYSDLRKRLLALRVSERKVSYTPDVSIHSPGIVTLDGTINQTIVDDLDISEHSMKENSMVRRLSINRQAMDKLLKVVPNANTTLHLEVEYEKQNQEEIVEEEEAGKNKSDPLNDSEEIAPDPVVSEKQDSKSNNDEEYKVTCVSTHSESTLPTGDTPTSTPSSCSLSAPDRPASTPGNTPAIVYSKKSDAQPGNTSQSNSGCSLEVNQSFLERNQSCEFEGSQSQSRIVSSQQQCSSSVMYPVEGVNYSIPLDETVSLESSSDTSSDKSRSHATLTMHSSSTTLTAGVVECHPDTPQGTNPCPQPRSITPNPQSIPFNIQDCASSKLTQEQSLSRNDTILNREGNPECVPNPQAHSITPIPVPVSRLTPIESDGGCVSQQQQFGEQSVTNSTSTTLLCEEQHCFIEYLETLHSRLVAIID